MLGWPETHRFLVEAFSFLRKGLNPATETENLATAFSTVLDKVGTEQQKQSLEANLIAAIQDNIECFRIESCLNCFKKCQNQDMKNILHLFLAGIDENNELVRKFGYLEETV